jgi:hypothetical protein
MTSQAWTPTKAAARLTHQLNAFAQAHGTERFPVDVTEVAREAAHLFGWDDPITEVEGVDFPGLEGALFSDEGRRRWKLVYNCCLTAGRARFTQAHELGHYILHRLGRSQFQCTEDDMLLWDDGAAMESQADTFASYLLMPLDDFRAQAATERLSLDLMSHCADRYGTSLTATILKWLEHTEESAILVVSRDGYMHWSRSSARARAAGAFFRTRGMPPVPVPVHSLAADTAVARERHGCEIDAAIWFPYAEERFSLRELKLTADQYDYVFTLLWLPRSARAWPPWHSLSKHGAEP